MTVKENLIEKSYESNDGRYEIIAVERRGASYNVNVNDYESWLINRLEKVQEEMPEPVTAPDNIEERLRGLLKKVYLDNPTIRDSIDTLTFNALESVPSIKKILGYKAIAAIRDFYLIGESFIATILDVDGQTGYDLIDQDSVRVLRVVADRPVYQTITQKGDFINPLNKTFKKGQPV